MAKNNISFNKNLFEDISSLYKSKLYIIIILINISKALISCNSFFFRGFQKIISNI